MPPASIKEDNYCVIPRHRAAGKKLVPYAELARKELGLGKVG
jgi:hypothetical protein